MELLFFTLASIAIVGAVGMIYFLQPIFSAISFIVTILAMAGIYAQLQSSFLFAIQIIIYAGAIVALILFIIMFLNIKEENTPQEKYKNRLILLSSLLMLPFAYLLISILDALPPVQPIAEGYGEIKSVGMTLFNDFILPFEMISILLLISLIGAVVLAQKKEPMHDDN